MKKLFLLAVLMFAFPVCINAGTTNVMLAWEPPEITTDVTGYRVFRGSASGVYTVNYDAGTASTFTVAGLADGTYYFAVAAYNARGQESPYSNEIDITLDTAPPKHPNNLKISGIEVVVDIQNGTVTSIMTTGK